MLAASGTVAGRAASGIFAAPAMSLEGSKLPKLAEPAKPVKAFDGVFVFGF